MTKQLATESKSQRRPNNYQEILKQKAKRRVLGEKEKLERLKLTDDEARKTVRFTLMNL